MTTKNDTTQTAATVESVVLAHAAKLEQVYNNRTAGDSTFLGLLFQFLTDLSPAVGVNLFPGQDATTQPARGSVVMIHGQHGTVYQRHMSDGLWHSTTGKVMKWHELREAAAPRMPFLLVAAPSTDR